jgi:hypothetical protein
MRRLEIIGGGPSHQPNAIDGDRFEKGCTEETAVFSQSASVALYATLVDICCVAFVRSCPISTSA